MLKAANSSRQSHYTKPEELEDFVRRSGVDSLAMSIGTSHDAYKFRVKLYGVPR
ncbi:MAG TPA: class II fructose-bisphosphate aldolase [Syntrophales bacterium]|nr:class II fructose-bisphosphate aldolase [Syntrophales bacterium]